MFQMEERTFGNILAGSILEMAHSLCEIETLLSAAARIDINKHRRPHKLQSCKNFEIALPQLGSKQDYQLHT